MSVRVSDRVWATAIAPAGRKLVALNLADRCNDEGGRLFVSMQRIADDCGISRCHAQRHVRALIEDGLLSVVANAAGGAPGAVPHYQIHVDRLAPPRTAAGAQQAPQFAPKTDSSEATGSTGDTGSTDATGGTGAQEGSHGRTGGVAPAHETHLTGATQTVLNHKLTVREPKTRASKSRSLPEAFGISERVQSWAAEKGFADLDAHLEYFVSYAKAGGKRYVDWDEAFMNAIRGNWAKVQGHGLNSQELLEKRNRAAVSKWAGAGAAIFGENQPPVSAQPRTPFAGPASNLFEVTDVAPKEAATRAPTASERAALQALTKAAHSSSLLRKAS